MKTLDYTVAFSQLLGKKILGEVEVYITAIKLVGLGSSPQSDLTALLGQYWIILIGCLDLL